MSQTRTRRASLRSDRAAFLANSPRTHRITTRLLRSQKAAVAALAAANGVSFNAQLTSMIWEVLR